MGENRILSRNGDLGELARPGLKQHLPAKTIAKDRTHIPSIPSKPVTFLCSAHITSRMDEEIFHLPLEKQNRPNSCRKSRKRISPPIAPIADIPVPQ